MENSVVSKMQIPGDTRVFPPEVMAKIFLMSIPDPAQPSATQSPLNVSRTCRLWRDIALSSPSLWAQLCLKGYTRQDPYCLQIMERWNDVLTTWIQRSGKATLNIEIDLSFALRMGRPTSNGQLFREMSSLLMRERSRWGDMKIDCRGVYGDIYLTIYNKEACTMNLDVDLTLSLHIQRLELKGFTSIEVGEAQFRFLTDLRLCLRIYSDPTQRLEMCTRILQQAPNLVMLHLTSTPHGHYHQIPYLGNSIVLTHLKELFMSDISLFNVEILQRLTLPALRDMELISHPEFPYFYDQHIVDLLHRWRPPLERLRLLYCINNSQVIIDALHHLPTLLKLDLYVHPSREFLRDLAINGSDGLCPLLRELAITSQIWPNDCVELLVDILVSRARRIRTFKVHMIGLRGQFDLLLADARVQGCIADGLVLGGC